MHRRQRRGHDGRLTRLGPGQWIKFLSDPFYVGVVWRTIVLGIATVLAATLRDGSKVLAAIRGVMNAEPAHQDSLPHR